MADAVAPTWFTPDQLALFDDHRWLVSRTVLEAVRRLPRFVIPEQLYAAGLRGLAQAARRFDATLGVPFRSYARIRVKGAIKDELREGDWHSPRQRRQHLDLPEIVTGGVNAWMAAAVAADDAFDAMATRIRYVKGGELKPLDGVPDPVHAVAAADTVAAILAHIPAADRDLIRLHYLSDPPLLQREIAARLGVSDARVSQLLADARARCRDAARMLSERSRVSDGGI